MTAAAIDLMAECHRVGLTVRRCGDRLDLESAKPPPALLLERLRHAKPVLLAMLPDEDAADKETEDERTISLVPDYHLVLAAQQTHCWDGQNHYHWREMTETERQPAQTAMRDAWIECGVNPPVGVDFGTWLPKALMGIKAREFFCNLPKHDNYPDTQ
ncbi:MAG: hypothetical protein WCK65_15115 [Rhodospirillaceae bacterium]